MSFTSMEQQFDNSMGCSSEPEPAMKSALVAPRKVSFASNIDVKEVPHLKDVPEEDLKATWYTQEEFECIKKSLIVTVRLMMAMKPIDSEQCTRGLEFRTPAGAKLRKKNKLDALTAVWNEQVSQWKRNRTDEEAISFVYTEQCQKVSEVARRMASQDEKDVRRYSEIAEQSDSSLSFVSLDGDNMDQLHEQPTRSLCSPAAA
jgi:hypothetical protein